MTRNLLQIFILLFILAACESSSTEGFRKLDNGEVAIANGATALGNKDYTKAIKYFNQAINAAKNNEQASVAYSGLALALLRSDRAAQNDAYERYIQALDRDADNLDAKAGKALMEFSFKNNLIQAIIDAEAVLAENDNFKNSIDSNIDRVDMLLIIAMSNMMQENYAAAEVALRRIAGQADFDVDETSAAGQQAIANKIDQLLAVNNQ
jgi:tetratricopeptide (TPR) repeat protein